MNVKTLTRAVEEAERFQRLARELMSLLPDVEEYYSPSKEGAAVKRASMDLTRALADMRKPL